MKSKIFVINLESRPDKLKHVTEQLNKQSILFERYPAIIGTDLSSETI